MTNELNTGVFDLKATVAGVLATKLSETGIELSEGASEVLVNHLLDSRNLTVDKLVDLGEFTHFEVAEGQTAPSKSLLVGNQIVYLYEKTRSVRAHAAEYEEYLEDNDLYEEDYGYDAYLRDNNLVETFPTETYFVANSVNVGDVLFSALREKSDAESRLEVANRTLEKIKPVVGEHFLPIL